MAAIKIGTSGLIQQPTAYSFTPSGGQIATYRYTGTHDDVSAAYNTHVGNYKEVQINPLDGGRSELVISVPTGVQQTWEVDIQWNERPVGQSNAFRAWFDALSSNTVRTNFMLCSEALRAGDEDGTGAAILALYDATFEAWAWDAATDVTIQEPTAVLRRTITWPAGDTSTKVNWTDVNKVWTTSQLTTPPMTPPDAICGTLPTAYWLMLSDQAEYGADGRFTASTIWVSGTYPTHRYTYKT